MRRGPFGHRDFRLLFLGRTTSFVGNAFANVALAFAVLELTGSKADLGYVLAARSLPQVIFLLAGGIWADRLPRHRVMVVSNLLSGLSQAAVVSYPDARLGEVGVAFVQVASGACVDPDDVIAFCRGRIASFKIPRHVFVVDELPMTSSGKVQKARLRDAALERLG